MIARQFIEYHGEHLVITCDLLARLWIQGVKQQRIHLLVVGSDA